MLRLNRLEIGWCFKTFNLEVLVRGVAVGVLIGFGLGSRPSLALGSDAISVAAQLPKRHAIMRTYPGDLNNDGRSDLLVVTRSWDEANDGDSHRPLIIFVRNSRGILRRVARADHVIACRNCGGLAGDPWRTDHVNPAFIRIRQGQFSIFEFAGSGWRGWNQTIFRYEPRDRRWSMLECRNKTFHVDHAFPVEFNRSDRSDFGLVWLEQFGIKRSCWR